uniref:Uncharacterized protein n=2 Tax=Plectus sambesii TaxID=2011161 RepID=A0A914XK86_9BILA
MSKGGTVPRYSNLQNYHHRSAPMGNGRPSADAAGYGRTASSMLQTRSTLASAFSTPLSTASSATSSSSTPASYSSAYYKSPTKLKSAPSSSSSSSAQSTAARNAAIRRSAYSSTSSYQSSMTPTLSSRSTSTLYKSSAGSAASSTSSVTAASRSSSVGAKSSDALDYYKYDRADKGHRLSGDSGFDSLLDLDRTMAMGQQRSRGRSAHRKRRSANGRTMRVSRRGKAVSARVAR